MNGRCGKHKRYNKRSETEMVRNVARKTEEDVVMKTWKWGWTPKDRKNETEMDRFYTKRHDGERSKDRRSTRPA